MKRWIITVVVLVALIALPVYAQQSGLTLEGLSSRIDVLFSGQQYLTNRIAALETAVAISSQQQVVMVVTATPIPPTPLPTATQPPPATYTPVPTRTPRPTATATRRPSATFTPVPAQAMVVVIRRQMLRRGPGTNHAVIDTVSAGDEFDILGKNMNGTWWQVEYEGQPAWISASHVDAFNTDRIAIVSTPTPLPSPTVADTATPVPTATTEVLSQDEWELMMELAEKDIEGMGRDPDIYTTAQMRSMASNLTTELRKAAENCGMDLMELARIIDSEALLLEETGIPKRLDAAARWDFIRTLTEYWDESVKSSCERKIVGRRLWIVANYGEEE